jgi:predicted DNA-binding protein (UPF0251 family)
MTREEAIDIRSRSLTGERVDINQLDEAMRIIATREPARHELPAGVTTNQWGLSIGMCETLTVVVSKGSEREAAIQLGVDPRAVKRQIQRAQERMGTVSNLDTLLAWDRFIRGAQCVV